MSDAEVSDGLACVSSGQGAIACVVRGFTSGGSGDRTACLTVSDLFLPGILSLGYGCSPCQAAAARGQDGEGLPRPRPAEQEPGRHPRRASAPEKGTGEGRVPLRFPRPGLKGGLCFSSLFCKANLAPLF